MKPADDSRGYRLADLKWVTDGEHEVADLKPVRIADRHFSQVLCLNPDDSNVRTRIRTDALRYQFAPVRECHDDFLRTVDHMAIGED